MRAVVIGYGSTLRGDDGIGPGIAKRVARLVKSRDVLVLIRQTLTPDLAADLEHAERAVFIDASATAAPGSVTELWLTARADASVAMVHFLEPASLLEWCLRAYGKAPQAVLITIGGRNFEIGETLSAETRSTIRPIVQRVISLVTQFSGITAP